MELSYHHDLYPTRPYLTWGEEHDLKLAQMKKLKEEEEARNTAAERKQSPDAG